MQRQAGEQPSSLSTERDLQVVEHKTRSITMMLQIGKR